MSTPALQPFGTDNASDAKFLKQWCEENLDSELLSGVVGNTGVLYKQLSDE